MSKRLGFFVAAASAAIMVICGPAGAQGAPRRHHLASAASSRPLTVRPRTHGIYQRGNDTIALGGFSANGYGYPAASPEDRRQYENARLRDQATIFGSGIDGIGGTGFESSRETGYNNPYWGNAYNSYVGYNGTPTILAFGPGFANRYAADHDPADDDDDRPGPSPRDLGYHPDVDE